MSLEGMSPLWQRLPLKMKVLVEKALWGVVWYISILWEHGL